MAITFFNSLAERQSSLAIKPFSACSYYEQEWVARPSGIKLFHQILLVLDGEGVLHADGKTYKLKKGCAFFTSKTCPNEYANHGKLITAFLTVDGSGIDALISHFECKDFVFMEAVNIEKYLNYINQILNEYYAHRREALISALSYSMFCDFFAEIDEIAVNENDKVIHFIEKHFTKKLTLDAIADSADISVSKLCHNFKERHGCTVFEYILDLRLESARNLIMSETGLQIKAVASASGFEDVSYFCRAYKKKFGKTPREDKSIF